MKRNLLFLFLLFLFNAVHSQIELITNGNFQTQNSGWTATNNFFYGNSNLTYCQSCPGYAYTSLSFNGGSGNNYTGDLYQYVTIPSNATSATLKYSYSIYTQETGNVPYDFCGLTINDGNTGSNLLYLSQLSNLDVTSSYVTQSFILPPSLYGQNIIVRFYVQTDNAKTTVFRIDDVSLIVTTSGGGGGGGGGNNCVSWANQNIPTDPKVFNAAEFLCINKIIDNNQNVNDLPALSLGDAAEIVLNALYAGSNNIPNQLPSDNLPCMVNDLYVLSYPNYKAVKALCFLEHTDGRSCINRDFFTIQPQSTITFGRILRMLLEGWRIEPDNNGSDVYSHSSSPFYINVYRDDPDYGYFQKAYNLGLLNDYTSGGYFSATNVGEFLYVLLDKLMHTYGVSAPKDADYYNPNNFSQTNIGGSPSIERAVFSSYEQNGFSIPSGGIGLDFDYSYHSNLLEYPFIAEDWSERGRQYGNLENHNAIQKNFPLGKGWTHSYNIFAQAVKTLVNGNIVETNVVFHWGDGSVYSFNIYQNRFETEGVYDQFFADNYSNGLLQSFHIITKNQITYQFYRDNNQFNCTTITDRNNNKILLGYCSAECQNYPSTCIGTSNNRLCFVVDDRSNRKLNFVYYTSSDLLQEVQDNIGRTIKFYPNTYTYNLDSVTNANSFTTHYKYCTGDTCKNLLTEIQRPKGNWVKNDYYKRKLKQTQTPNYTTSINFNSDYTNANSPFTQTSVQTTLDVGTTFTTNYTHNYLGEPTLIQSGTTNQQIAYNDPQNRTLPTQINDLLTGVTTQNWYDNRGNLISHQISNGGLYQYTQIQYNGFNDPTRIIKPNGAIFDIQYDWRGNKQEELGPLGLHNIYTVNSDGTINTLTGATGIVKRFGYNTFGNPNSITIDNTNIAIQAEYDAVSRIRKIKDPNNIFSKYIHDNNDNITETTIDTAGLNLTTKYIFDKNDNINSIIAPKGDITSLTHDQNDDLVQEDYGAYNRKWQYYNDGSLKSYTTKKGVVLSDIYFGTGSQFEGKLQQHFLNTYTYLGGSKQLYTNTRGNGVLYHNYDPLQRLTGVQFSENPANPQAFTSNINYTYDISNFQTNISIPRYNKSFTYIPDVLNRISEVRDWNYSLLVRYHYRVDGLLDFEELGNNMFLYYHYDNAGRLDSMYAKNSFGKLLYAVGATLDAKGNHTTESIFVDTTGLHITTYYPSAGTNTHQIDFQTNRLVSSNGKQVISDANGNILSNPQSNFNTTLTAQYDFLDNLTNCTVDNQQHSFLYDPNDNRFGIDSTRYITDFINNGNVLAQSKIGYGLEKIYCHSPLGLVCSIDPNTNERTWYLYDFRGSTIALVDDNQNVVCYNEYAPFGEILASSHTPGTATQFLYVGKYGVEYHSPHLYYMRARYYDPTNGRFYGEDPVWNKNLFAYADNNPVMNIDPDGKTNKKISHKKNWIPTFTSYNDKLNMFSTLLEKAGTGITLGVQNLKLYWTGWGGGSKARISTIGIPKIASSISTISYLTQMGVDAYGYSNESKYGKESKNSISVGKFVSDGILGFLGLFAKHPLAIGILTFLNPETAESY